MLGDTFADGHSLVHELDPRAKALAALVFSVMTAVADRFPALVLALVLAATMVGMAKLPTRAVAYRLLLVNSFVLLLWCMLPLTYPGQAVAHVGPLTLSREGIVYALLITIKSNAIILFGIALLSTTQLTRLGQALTWLRVPDKMIQVLLFMLRYIEVISRDYQRLKASMNARCFRPGANMHTYRSYANMVGMLLVTSYERASAIYSAMLCRGFRGKFYTASEFSFSRTDALFGASVAVLALIMLLLGWPGLL
ncbi:MAG: cobalt ECF transporter T component CbiQ [Candidatus Abyssubacteria bacterium]